MLTYHLRGTGYILQFFIIIHGYSLSLLTGAIAAHRQPLSSAVSKFRGNAMICPHCNVHFWEEWDKTGALVWDDENKGQGIKHTPCPNCGRLIIKVFEGKIDPDKAEFETNDEDD